MIGISRRALCKCGPAQLAGFHILTSYSVSLWHFYTTVAHMSLL